ncbi:hypothetical protein HPHPA11_1135 [Helicobacter pylori Hp A-11]|uniref:Uncharacterized protein n=1 Tax=Helicobacter pylori Hp A-11 TaxID=992035 RepID=N4TC09_HELPX|nr:hypothetical protein HPHPA11_1135 [Helicobacter pylori Hp A-11]
MPECFGPINDEYFFHFVPFLIKWGNFIQMKLNVKEIPFI